MSLVCNFTKTIFLSPLILAISLAMVTGLSARDWQGDFGLGTDGEVRTLAAGPNGEIYAGGDFLRAGAIEARHLAVWTGEEWLNIGNFDNRINRLFVHESTLYAGGSFREITTPSGQVIAAERVARYDIDSGEWSTMGSGFDDVVITLEVDGSGNLVAGGCFTHSGSTTLNRIARWSGTGWTAYTTGTQDHTFYGIENNCVRSLYYDHDTSRLYVGGDFRTARIFDSTHESTDGYRSTWVGGIVYREAGSWNMVGGGLYSSRPASAFLEIEQAAITLITKDPVTGKMIFGGSFDFALYDEIQDLQDVEANDPVYPRYLATWDGQTWGEEMTLSSVRPSNFSVRKFPRRLIFEGDLIYVFGELRGSINRDDQPAFDAYGLAVYSRSEGRFLLDENGNSILGNGAWFRGGGVTTSRYLNDAVKSGDDIYMAGDFNAFQPGAGPLTAVDMDNITRWDRNTYNQLGLGVDGSQISVVRKFGDTYYFGGTFSRAYSGSRTWESAMVVGYDPASRDFFPFARGVSGAGVQGLARVRDIAEDPATGDIYVAGRFIYGIQEDGEEVSSRSLLRFSNGAWHAVASLTGGGTGANQVPEATSLLRVGDQLYIGGRFSSIPDRHEHQLHIAQIDLPTGKFVPIPFAEELRLNQRLIVDLETDGRYLYMLLHPENASDIATGSVLRKNLVSGEVTSINGIVRGSSNTFSVTSMQADGEFIWVAGQLQNFRYFDENGQLQTVSGIPNVMILHPDTETWFFPPEDLFPTGMIYDIAKTGNTIYLANAAANDTDRGKRIDLGKREAFNTGNGFSTTPLSLLLDDDRVWISGLFDIPRRLARKEVVESALAPFVKGSIQLTETTVRTGLRDTLNLYIANLGNADLTWNVSLAMEETGGYPVGEGLITLPSASGNTSGAAMSLLPLTIDAAGIPTGRYRANFEIVSNDNLAEEMVYTLDVTVNPLMAASGPYPASGSIEAPIDSLLAWNRDEFAETIRVYLGTSPDLGEDDLIYEGEPLSQLDLPSTSGPLQFYTDYYWRVDQVNAVSESEGEVWTFRTRLNPDEGIWVPVATNQDDRFLDVHFFDRNNGFILGNNDLFTTDDGGNTLTTAYQEGVLSDFSLLSQHFINENTGWISGRDGVILRTDNSGETWNRLESGVTERLNSIFFLDASDGWVTGHNGTMLSTSDGGTNWDIRESGVTRHLRKVLFINENIGFAAGARGTVITSSDGGATWQNRSVPGGGNLFSLYFRDASTGWVGSNDGVIFGTNDGGLTWTERYRDPAGLSLKNTINDIGFMDSETGWAVGGNFNRSHLLITTDGGHTWNTRPAFTDQELNGIQINSSTEAWIVGNSGTLLRYTTDPTDTGSILPVEVVLGLPADGAGDVELQPVLSWNDSGRAELYQLQISEHADFSSLIINESTIADNTFSMTVELNPLTTYYWRVRGLNDAGSGDWSPAWSFTTSTATSITGATDIPREVSLSQNYPNPFNPATTIRFGLPEQADVRLEVYNLIGRRVAVLVSESRNAGWHTATFDASALASGVYFYRLQAGAMVITRKLTLVK